MQKQRGLRRLLAWISALFLLCSCQGVLAWNFNDLFEGAKPNLASPSPVMELKTPIWKINREINERALRCSGENLRAIYDGDDKTCGGGETAAWATLDLGFRHRLAGVRFLPDAKGEPFANRCLGTRFLVSNDNRTFLPVATIEPIDSGDYTAEWKEILFDSAGEYRYLRVEIPAGGYFGEIQWLEYGEWSYERSRIRGMLDLSMGLYAQQVTKDTDALILTGVYNQNGVLTRLVKTIQSFPEGKETSVWVTVPGVLGKQESYRVVALEEDGSPVIRMPLCYQDNNCAPALTLSNLFSDHMLFQAEKPLTIWGKAPAGERVTVALESDAGDRVAGQTIAKKDFSWEVNLGSFSPGGSYRMTVACGTKKKIYENITFGDVWLCVGQSNMDYFMLGGEDTENYLASEQGQKEAENPNIRLVNLWNKGIGGSGSLVENLPVPSGEDVWTPMNRDTANYCSAVGYFFSQGLEREYHIPIGLLSVAVGDTEINRWIPCGESYGSFTSTDGGLFHNRVAPFQKLQIRGILMYQGEADQYRTGLTTTEYRDAMAGLVDRYRSIWGEDLPFYWAQLTRYKKDESAVREGQRLALGRIGNPKNAGIISLIDLYGEYEAGQGNCREDIHPHQKKEVAERFLRYAKRDVYGDAEIAVSGPVYQRMQVVGNRMELTFISTGDLKVLPMEQYADKQGREKILEGKTDTSVPREFEIAGEDGVYFPADATIEGNKIILESPEVPMPQSARYAWGAYPEMPNLTDETGLPALSFSTEIVR